MEILSNINELEEKDMDGQGRKTSIVFIIIISLLALEIMVVLQHQQMLLRGLHRQ